MTQPVGVSAYLPVSGVYLAVSRRPSLAVPRRIRRCHVAPPAIGVEAAPGAVARTRGVAAGRSAYARSAGAATGGGGAAGPPPPRPPTGPPPPDPCLGGKH